MRKALFLFFCFFLSLSPALSDKYDDVKNDPAFAQLKELEENIAQKLPIIEERMKKINPELVESVKDNKDEIKLITYTNYLAEKTFNYYKDFFLWDMEQKGKETGRVVKNEDYGEKYYWLDRGVLDSDQCNENGYSPKNNGRQEINKMLRYQREHTCLFPDGFEEYSIIIQQDGYNYDEGKSKGGEKTNEISVSKDNLSEGLHIVYDITLDVQHDVYEGKNDFESIQDIMFMVGYDVYDYTEWHNYRNQSKQDVKDGLYQYIPKKKQECLPGLGCTIIEAKNLESWKSSHVPGSKYNGIMMEKKFQSGKHK